MSAQGLSAAKKRRGGGVRGEFGGAASAPVNAKVGGGPQMSKGQVAPNRMTTQDAIYLLNTRIMSLETMLKNNLQQVETKFGEHDSYIADNIPDINLMNQAFSDINSRLIELESLGTRLSTIESKLDIKPTKHSQKTSAGSSRSTEVVEESSSKGISFSINED
jgi:hypothetical protein